jgi:hypothetical protein
MQQRNPRRPDDDDRELDDEPKQPGDTDYELSEEHGYSNWEPPKRNWIRPAIIIFSLFMLASMILPMFAVFFQ